MGDLAWAAFWAACGLVYALGWGVTARMCFHRLRPYTEPLSCSDPKTHKSPGFHWSWCYQKPGLGCSSCNEALAISALVSLVWPPVLLVTGGWALAGLAAGSGRETREELEAKIARLEREMEIGKGDGY